jgi:CBS domain-containing protein
MQIELIEIRDFLAAHHPFDALPEDALDRLPRLLSVRYLRRGTPFPPPDADARYLYVVRQGAVELRDRRGELIDKLGEGDLSAAACRGDGPEGAMIGVTAEDTLLYLLPCAELDALRRDHPAFGRHFDASLAERLRKAIDLLQDAPLGGASLLSIAAGGLVGRPPVFASPQESIRDAASRMTRERVSSLLVMDGDTLLGLLTDRDLRSRCLAAGLDAGRPIREIMTAGVHTVDASTPGFEVLMRMTRLNIHHLPVVDGARVLGIVSTTDLIRHESANTVYLVGAAHKADSTAALAAVSRKLPELQVQLVFAGASARHVGEAVSAVNDAITQRLVELALRQLGPPPVRYAWVTGGSHARREQTAHSDQDNALILADDSAPDDDRYFEALARFVNDGLNACGLVYCPGEVMASNPKWRQPRAQWRRYFDTWIDAPEPMALMLSSVFFDLRVVHGDAELLEALQRENLERSRENGIFLAYMTANALTQRPPLGFFRNIVLIRGGEHDRSVDVKLRGVMPVVNLARVYALSEGRAELNTVDRLRATAGTPALSAEGARDLEDAYAFIGALRARHQARALRAGRPADNFVAPDALSALERAHLKDAFRVIATMQQALERRYPPGASR